jgi:hypothetical protein
MLRDNLAGLIEPMRAARELDPLALFTKQNKSSDDRPQHALKIPAPKGRNLTLTENAASPFHAEPRHADVHLEANAVPNALTVPIEAVRRSDDGASVLVIDAKNRVEPRDVKLGIDGTNSVQILSGLSQGEQVIVGNLGAYHPGELVRPKPAVFAASGGSGIVE